MYIRILILTYANFCQPDSPKPEEIATEDPPSEIVVDVSIAYFK